MLEEGLNGPQGKKKKRNSFGPTSWSDVAPAGDPGVNAAVEGAVWSCQADRQDVFGETHRRGELQEADVIVVGVGVVVGMIDDLCYLSRHLIGVKSFLSLATQIHNQTACAGPEVNKRKSSL